MLLLQKNKGQGINTTCIIVIPLCTSFNFLSISLWFFLHILIDNIKNLIKVCINVDIYKMLLLGKNMGLGINTNIVIPLCSS